MRSHTYRLTQIYDWCMICALSILSTLVPLFIIRMVSPEGYVTKFASETFLNSLNIFILYLILSTVAFGLKYFSKPETNILDTKASFFDYVIAILGLHVIAHFFKEDISLLWISIGTILFGPCMKYVINDQAQFLKSRVWPFIHDFNLRRYSTPSNNSVTIFVRFLLLILIGLILVSPIMYFQKRSIDIREARRKEFTITSIIPKESVVAEEVTLLGYNFRWRDNDSYIINSTYGPIVSNVWEDTKVTFIVPLHLQNGEMEIWLERSAEESNKKVIVKSNIVRFKLLPREIYFATPEDSVIQKAVKKIKRSVFLQ